MATTVRSHAKINLGLGLGAPRPDGFHGLATIYQTLALHDLVRVVARPAAVTQITLTSSDARVPSDHRNTAWKMVELALDALKIRAEVELHIEKRLPVQGGLGAGSANAVAALVGLEAELAAHIPGRLPAQPGRPNRAPFPALAFDLNSPDWAAQRLRLAEHVGSDVPLFLLGGTVLGIDRGQQVYPLPDVEPTWCVVAVPEIGVSTPQAFRDWDTHCAASGLTPEASTAKLNELSRVYACALSGAEFFWNSEASAGSSGVLPTIGEDLAGPRVSALVRTGIVNDFEQVVFPQYPLLSAIKRNLAATGSSEASLYAALSGSGSALFGLYRGLRNAKAACQRLESAGVASLLTRTLPRLAYWREMLEK